MNKEWNYINGAYEFYFYPYEEDNLVLTFVQDKNNENVFWYSSGMLKVEDDCIESRNVESAKEDFEDMIYNELEDRAAYYSRLSDMFWE